MSTSSNNKLIKVKIIKAYISEDKKFIIWETEDEHGKNLDLVWEYDNFAPSLGFKLKDGVKVPEDMYNDLFRKIIGQYKNVQIEDS